MTFHLSAWGRRHDAALARLATFGETEVVSITELRAGDVFVAACSDKLEAALTDADVDDERDFVRYETTQADPHHGWSGRHHVLTSRGLQITRRVRGGR